jgi:PEGA domain-containing protein
MPFTRRPDSWLYLSGSKGLRNGGPATAPASNDSLPEFVSETIPPPQPKPHGSIAVHVRRNDDGASSRRIRNSTADFFTAIQRAAATLIAALIRRRPDLRRLAASATVSSFAGGAVAGVLIMWFVGAQPPSPAVPSTTQSVALQATLPLPDRPALSSNVADQTARTDPAWLPSPIVPVTARPVSTSGHSTGDLKHAVRPARTPALSAKPRTAAAAPHASYRGSLAFQSAPQGAQVFVNGAFVGSTPLILENLPVGSRAVRIEADGYQRWSTSTRVVANQQTRVSATLGRVIR